jgi:predicted transposase/invertase (TIGR01784 family)
MPLGIEPTVDYAFKKLFASEENKDLLIHLLNAVLDSSNPIVEVEILTPFNPKEFAEDKLSIVDLKARCASGRQFNVEMQNRVDLSLRPRLAYYTALLFSSQLQEGEDYETLMPAITICFLSEIMFRKSTSPHLRFTLSDQTHSTELTDGLQVHTIELPKYNFQSEGVNFADDLERWSFFLREAANLEIAELRELLPNPEFIKATKVMEMIAKTPEERMQYEARRKAELDHKWLLGIARREGMAEARKLSKISAVQRSQTLLQVPISPESELLELSEDELNRLDNDLFAQLQRGKS